MSNLVKKISTNGQDYYDIGVKPENIEFDETKIVEGQEVPKNLNDKLSEKANSDMYNNNYIKLNNDVNAPGIYSVAIGNGTTTNHNNSFVFGEGISQKNDGDGQFIFGKNNNYFKFNYGGSELEFYISDSNFNDPGYLHQKTPISYHSYDGFEVLHEARFYRLPFKISNGYSLETNLTKFEVLTDETNIYNELKLNDKLYANDEANLYGKLNLYNNIYQSSHYPSAYLKLGYGQPGNTVYIGKLNFEKIFRFGNIGFLVGGIELVGSSTQSRSLPTLLHPHEGNKWYYNNENNFKNLKSLLDDVYEGMKLTHGDLYTSFVSVNQALTYEINSSIKIENTNNSNPEEFSIARVASGSNETTYFGRFSIPVYWED